MVMRSRVILETNRLRLRTWTEKYGALLNTHCNTDAVMEHLGGKMSAANHRKMFKWLVEQQEDYGPTFWAMERKDDGEFLGFCGLVQVDEADSTVLGATEIGWRLREDAQGHGFATEAAIACLHYAFRELDGLRVVSRTIERNNPSLQVMKRLGMRHDPRIDYTPSDGGDPLVVYVTTYEDWKRIKKDHPDTAI